VRDWRLHHVGIATPTLARLGRRLEAVGFEPELEFTDPAQGVTGLFTTVGDLRIELLAPLDNDPTLAPWLTHGNRMYQVAVEVADLEAEIESVVEAGGRLVRPPLPAVAFDGRRVAFLMVGAGFLVELIET
jgi:methylmalonyl-CoA/ethylmalonyl-CoA epimerase